MFETQLTTAFDSKSTMLGAIAPLVASLSNYVDVVGGAQRATDDFNARVAHRQATESETLEQSETYVQGIMEAEILDIAAAMDTVTASA